MLLARGNHAPDNPSQVGSKQRERGKPSPKGNMKDTIERDELETFIEALKTYSTADVGLFEAIIACSQAGYDRADMVEAGMEAGFSESYVRNVVSRVLIEKGERKRKTSHKRIDPRAVDVGQKALAVFGADTVKVLRAAYRWAEAEAKKAKAPALKVAA